MHHFVFGALDSPSRPGEGTSRAESRQSGTNNDHIDVLHMRSLRGDDRIRQLIRLTEVTQRAEPKSYD